MDEHIFDKIHEVDMQKTMESYYIDYAMSVIASRALPDVRDGLKPVQRRILYSMIELNNGPDKPHRKCARIVGDTMGKYHPHGDSSIYEALVKLAQDFNTRYPLVDGHGNFGSVDGDGAAAMRYTEARLSKISMEMTADINKNTVDFVPNFDETEKEPTVLPSRYPNLLVNGTSGIAVGMATNIPPHNLREVIAAVVKIIDNKIEKDADTTIEEILEIIKGPDFPTGGTIIGKMGIEEAYRTGRAKIKVRAVTDIEPMQNGKNRIVVTELPYMVNKARLIEKIAELARDKKMAVIMSLHELDLAQKVSDTVACVRGDRIDRIGTPEKIFAGNYVQELYGVADQSFDPVTGQIFLCTGYQNTRDFKDSDIENCSSKDFCSGSQVPDPVSSQIFVIGGAGSGIPVYNRLWRENIPFAAGILQENDVEYKAAVALASEVVSEKAFYPVGQDKVQEAKRLIDSCKKCICAVEEFGPLNEANRELAEYARRIGKTGKNI